MVIAESFLEAIFDSGGCNFYHRFLFGLCFVKAKMQVRISAMHSLSLQCSSRGFAILKDLVWLC